MQENIVEDTFLSSLESGYERGMLINGGATLDFEEVRERPLHGSFLTSLEISCLLYNTFRLFWIALFL